MIPSPFLNGDIMWQIITKEQAAEFARVNVQSVDDIWYDNIVGIVERYTGWSHLEEAATITERFHGNGTPFLLCQHPINSVTSIQVSNSLLSSSSYIVDWSKIYLINDDVGNGIPLNVFKKGIKNILITYNAGGTDSLPSSYLQSLKNTLLLCLKEMIAIPRNEGSDQTLRKYRPDRTMAPEEVLQSYGIHGKIQGIIKTNLPNRIRVT